MSNLIKKVKIMQEDGTFTDYIPLGAEAENINVDGESVETKLGKKPYYYDTVADMKADVKLKAGDMVITLGYYSVNDGKDDKYFIRTKTNEDVIDEKKIISLVDVTIVAEKIKNNIINRSNIHTNPINLGAFISIMNKTDEYIKNTISDLIAAKVKNYNMIVEIEPNATDKAGYEGGTLTIDDINFECLPDVTTINYYVDYAKEQGLNLFILKFHSLWAKRNLDSADYNKFIAKYKIVVINTLNSLNNKPEYVGLLNEYYSIFTNDTKNAIVSLLEDVKETNVKVGLCGITYQITTLNLASYVDVILPHFYPYATMKGESATIQDVYEGIERSKSGEKVLLYFNNLYPDKEIIISEVGASSYWEALAQPEAYWGNTAGATFDSNGMPMALYARGALKYYSQFKIQGIFIFWTDVVPKYLREFFLDYYERGEF